MSGLFILDRVYKKLRRNDDGREKTGGCIEQPQPRLLTDVGNMAKIPGDEIVDLMK